MNVENNSEVLNGYYLRYDNSNVTMVSGEYMMDSSDDDEMSKKQTSTTLPHYKCDDYSPPTLYVEVEPESEPMEDGNSEDERPPTIFERYGL